MGKILLRIIIASAISILLSSLGVKGSVVVLQTLFTILGIVFSIAMSLLVSFDLSKILNKQIRMRIREAISNTRNKMLFDFGTSSVLSTIALTWNSNSLRYFIHLLNINIVIDVILTAVSITTISLIYEIYNFQKINSLNVEIEEAVIEEEIK